MTTTSISDSESEEQFNDHDLNRRRLLMLIKNDRQHISNVRVKKTHLLDTSLFNVVQDIIDQLEDELEEESEDENEPNNHTINVPSDTINETINITSDTINPTSDAMNPTSDILNPTSEPTEPDHSEIPISRELLDLSTWRDYSTGSSRTRDLPFFKKHIYVIDCVEYNMRVSRQRAQELVQQNPEFIEMFRNDTLVEFLKSGKRKKKKQKNTHTAKVNKENPGHEEIQKTQESQDSLTLEFPPVNESEEEDSYKYGSDNDNDNGNSNSSSSDSDSDSDSNSSTNSDSDDESEQPQLNAIATVKGRHYDGIDQISRHAGLPKSFFSLQKQQATKYNIKKRKPQIERVGLAKKKKSMTQFSSNLANDFRVDDDDFINEDVEEEENNENSDDDNDDPRKVILISEHDDIVRKDDEPDLLMFDNEGSTFFRTNDNLNNDSDSDIVEEVGFVQPMLAGRSNKKHLITPRKRLQTPRKRNILPKTRRFKRTPIGSTKTKTRTTTPRSRFKSPPTVLSSSTPSTIFEEYNNFNHNQSNLKYIDNSDDENPLKTPSKPSKLIKTPKKKTSLKRKKEIHLFAPSPNVILPKRANVATTVYEGLGDRIIFVKKPKRKVNNPIIEEIPETILNGSNANDKRFLNSKVYEILFRNRKIDMNNSREVLEVFGIKLSKLDLNLIEKFELIFQKLIKPLKNISTDEFMKNLINLSEFLIDVNKENVASLLKLIDDFKLKIEINIRRRNKVFDVEFYLISWITILFKICFKILQDNSLKLFEFDNKFKEIVNMLFWMISEFDRSDLSLKFKQNTLFNESISIIFTINLNLTWKCFNQSEINDLSFLKNLSIIYPNKSNWKKIKDILKIHFNNISSPQFEKLKQDFFLIDYLINELNWEIDEDTISILSEILKKSKFKFPNENSSNNNLSIFKNGIIKTTVTNVYLNILMGFKGQLSGRLLEKLIPVSKITFFDRVIFINRINLLLCLSDLFKKNLEYRLTELLTVSELTNEEFDLKIIQIMINLINLNNENKFVLKFEFLEDFINKLLIKKKFILFHHFISQLQFSNLLTKSKLNFISIITKFQSNLQIIRLSSSIIKQFISTASPNDSSFIKKNFQFINSNLYPEIWCHVHGFLVSNNIDNWSRLIQFSNFNDDAYFYCYILKHSPNIYSIEKDTFISSLIKNVIKRNFSPSLNSFIREIVKVDVNFIDLQKIFIQTNRFQILMNIISVILKMDSEGLKSRYLSLIINYLKLELSNDDNSYNNFARKIVEFINLFGFEYVKSSLTFGELCHHFKIKKSISNDELNMFIDDDLNKCLKEIQQELINSNSSSVKFNEKYIPLLIGYKNKKNELMKDSKYYSFCCLISINIECSSDFTHLLLKTLVEILNKETNLTRVDIYCFLTLIKSFPYVVYHRSKKSLVEIYKILSLLYQILSGSNDLSVFIKLSEPFLNQRIISNSYYNSINADFMIRPPIIIKEMINHIQEIEEQNESLDNELSKSFNSFITKVEDVDYFSGYLN